MFSKRQKKLLSHALRDRAWRKDWIVETDTLGLRDKWRRVRCPWDDEMTIQYRIMWYPSYRQACEHVDEIEESSRRLLPAFDCSGQSFISHTYVGCTNIPNMFVIILYWSLDV